MANGESYDIKIPEGGSWRESKFLVFNLLIQQGKNINDLKRSVRSLQMRVAVFGAIGSFVGMIIAKVAVDYFGKLMLKFTSTLIQFFF